MSGLQTLGFGVVFTAAGRQAQEKTFRSIKQFRSIKRIMTTVGFWGSSLESSLSFKCKTPGKAANQHRWALEA